MTKVAAIVGPTAVGKTASSIQIARDLDGEVISGDSMQVYKGLDIGTAKIMPDEMQGIPHHLINIRQADEHFSVADFQDLANRQINEIAGRGRLPLIVGGTGFYVQALVDNLNLGSNGNAEDPAIRKKWEDYGHAYGKQALWNKLQSLDSEATAKIPVNNVRRVVRALEVISVTGQPFSQQPQHDNENQFYLIGLTTDRKVLYQRINQRVDLMVKNGLVEEARQLWDAGGPNWQSGKGIGYHELFPYFAGQCSLNEAINKIKLDSRHYAKRQLTWFRNKMNVHWYDLVSGKDSTKEIEVDLKNWLKK
ncbi:tRNA (adenosine(37)-N6)-dimethylallyltransferase MiaA [Limosilactobacillus sp.]|uniref:tRNA (adenosine(37)-N6)-dimethylallyltransferase MiaA n=1 Tax=Limosilactobacillus sp. TaxID=2773925 RepID=UPI00345E4235